MHYLLNHVLLSLAILTSLLPLSLASPTAKPVLVSPFYNTKCAADSPPASAKHVYPDTCFTDPLALGIRINSRPYCSNGTAAHLAFISTTDCTPTPFGSSLPPRQLVRLPESSLGRVYIRKSRARWRFGVMGCLGWIWGRVGRGCIGLRGLQIGGSGLRRIRRGCCWLLGWGCRGWWSVLLDCVVLGGGKLGGKFGIGLVASVVGCRKLRGIVIIKRKYSIS
jgi:hypothetical protein